RSLRREMQIIFQDPYASLNPRMTVGGILEEPLIVHGVGNAMERRARVNRLLDLVGLASYHAGRYPHEFSGGQRQRIGIARALALKPKLVVADEPVSALDVSIQAQVVNLMDDLQSELGLTYMIIAHDLSVIRHVSDRIAVMYLGKVVELADRKSLYEAPMHPYTNALMSAVPVPDPRRRGQKSERILLKGDVPSPISPPTGCRFHTRCWKATQICATTEPPLLRLKSGHQVACHHPENGEDQAPGDAPLPASADDVEVIAVKAAAKAEPAPKVPAQSTPKAAEAKAENAAKVEPDKAPAESAATAEEAAKVEAPKSTEPAEAEPAEAAEAEAPEAAKAAKAEAKAEPTKTEPAKAEEAAEAEAPKAEADKAPAQVAAKAAKPTKAEAPKAESAKAEPAKAAEAEATKAAEPAAAESDKAPAQAPADSADDAEAAIPDADAATDGDTATATGTDAEDNPKK
ncbi:MAG TPA: oligopeptide/dipeptide ABC transporter ATP-binding protein, partial [Streptomyces sp.]